MPVSPTLHERIISQIRDFGGALLYDIEKELFKKVFRKLAFGHLAFENDTLAWDSPYSIGIHLLSEMSDSRKNDFLRPYRGD